MELLQLEFPDRDGIRLNTASGFTCREYGQAEKQNSRVGSRRRDSTSHTAKRDERPARDISWRHLAAYHRFIRSDSFDRDAVFCLQEERVDGNALPSGPPAKLLLQLTTSSIHCEQSEG